MPETLTEQQTSSTAHLRKELFCSALPTQPLKDLGKILVTGASGYIGSILVEELLARGYMVRVMVRSKPEVYKARWPGAEVVVADVMNAEQLEQALDDVGIAYYLIHSLYQGKAFETLDRTAAANFRDASQKKGVKRIIYLGGLGKIGSSLSHHLGSRSDTAIELFMGTVPVTAIRAAIIIGPGGSSYELIHELIKRFPVLLIPSSARGTKCQPIALRDIIKYLVGVLETPETADKMFDVGGADIVTYEEMLKIFANVLNRKILFLPSFISNSKFYAFMTSLFTPTPFSLTQSLLEGLRNDVVSQDNSIRSHIPFEPHTYREALLNALTREEQDRIYSLGFCPSREEFAMKLKELKGKITYQWQCSLLTEKSAHSLFSSFCRVEGKRGWFSSSWILRFRAFIDPLFRKTCDKCREENRSQISSFRVEETNEDKRLLLRVQMKSPGMAWLEFKVDSEENRRKLTLTAFYQTKSIAGKIYWFFSLPFHVVVFRNLIKEIEKNSSP